MQFRNRDFGMERCVLVLSIPQQTPDLIPNVRLAEGSPISVWLLDPDAPELHPSISWGTAPRRHRKLATFVVSMERNQTSEEFFCAGDKFSTFEFECAETNGCEVEFWQNKEKPFQGEWRGEHDRSEILISSRRAHDPAPVDLLIVALLLPALPSRMHWPVNIIAAFIVFEVIL